MPGELLPQRIWIDFRNSPVSGLWRVYTTPNPFAETGYFLVQTPLVDGVLPCAWCKANPETSAVPNKPVTAVRCVTSTCPVRSHGWMSPKVWNTRAPVPTGELFTIKPLVWEMSKDGFRAVVGTRIISVWKWAWSPTWMWSAGNKSCQTCVSPEQGKQLAEAHWRGRETSPDL